MNFLTPIAAVLLAAGHPAQPSISLEVRLFEPPQSSQKAVADPELERLMSKASAASRRSRSVLVSVVLRAHQEVIVNPHRISIELRDLSDSPLGVRGCILDPDFNAEQDRDYRRLHRGESVTTIRGFDPGCYALHAGEKYGVVAMFEDSGDPLRAAPPAGVVVAMRRVVSRRLVLTLSDS